MGKALGVGLIGTGYMGKCHALAWNAVAAVYGDVDRPQLAMLAEIDADLAARKAAELGFARSTGDWKSLVDDPAIDVISITTPNRYHAEMAIYALARGKHVWCEKPMATRVEDAEAMRMAARESRSVAALGYNYIQNPAMRHAKALIADGTIGAITHVRVEMDEDFMADPHAHFSWRSDRSSGHGALDDFGVHAFSLLQALVPAPRRLCCQMAKPYATRPLPGGGERTVETADVASLLLTLENGASGAISLNRSAWGRKGRIFVQIFGAKGSLVYDQERLNELQFFAAEGGDATHGFRTILSGPAHEPYGLFCPAPGHSLGFNDLKIIECRELLRRIDGAPAHLVDFEAGYQIERWVDAAAQSHREGRWIELR
jgi:predicted dehydrogenase